MNISRFNLMNQLLHARFQSKHRKPFSYIVVFVSKSPVRLQSTTVL